MLNVWFNYVASKANVADLPAYCTCTTNHSPQAVIAVKGRQRLVAKDEGATRVVTSRLPTTKLL